MVQGIRCLLCQSEDLSLTLEPTRQAKNVGTHQCWEVETDGSLKIAGLAEAVSSGFSE